MSSEHDKERQACIRAVAPHGWWVKGSNPKTGYTTLFCSCEIKHRISIPKTPSNPATFRLKARQMIRTCSTAGQA